MGFLSTHHLWTWNNTENVTTKVFWITHCVHGSLFNFPWKHISKVPKGKYVTVGLSQEENRNFQIWYNLGLFQLYPILRGHRHDPYNWGTCSVQRHVSHIYDDVIKWKHFPRYWAFVRGIHRSPVNSPHKGQWRGALKFSLIFAWTNGCVNNRDPGDFRRRRVNYDITVMW